MTEPTTTSAPDLPVEADEARSGDKGMNGGAGAVAPQRLRRRFARPETKLPSVPAEVARTLTGLRPGRTKADAEPEAQATSSPIREGDHALEAMRRDALHRRLLAVADMVSTAVALSVAILAAGAEVMVAAIAMLPLMVLVGKIVGLYDRDEHVLHKTTLDEAPSLLNVAVAGTLLMWMFDEVLASNPFRKFQVAILFAVLFLGLALSRSLARRIALAAAPAERLLVLGSAEETTRLMEKLDAQAPLKAEVVGRVPVGPERRSSHGKDVLGILPDLDYLLADNRIDRVVICPHGESSGEMLETIRLVKALGVKVSVVPRLFEVVGTSVEFDELGGLTLLGIRRYELTKSSAALKRALDVCGAAAGLVLLAPVFLSFALGIKLTSSGDVFFRQPRVGRRGRAFDMLKFRTMYEGADRVKSELVDLNEGADGFFKISADPRITPIGRLLRRMSLDELPQLINVLRGEMSLVGPRPLVSEEDARIEGLHRGRLEITPGMTGAWQILGSSRIPMRDMVTIDYLYRANWSLWLDIKILLRTVPHVLRRRGM
jgi:exopolysaccharide biosynthesis polyprenyl glycosylphosphotransferase